MVWLRLWIFMYCSPFSLIAYFTKFICVCYRINFTGGQWKKAVKRENINQWSRVAAGIVHFCTWIMVCCTCLGLTIKNLAVVLRSASGSFRCWLQKTRCCWASITLKPCCQRDNHLARLTKTYLSLTWKKCFVKKGLLNKNAMAGVSNLIYWQMLVEFCKQ